MSLVVIVSSFFDCDLRSIVSISSEFDLFILFIYLWIIYYWQFYFRSNFYYQRLSEFVYENFVSVWRNTLWDSMISYNLVHNDPNDLFRCESLIIWYQIRIFGKFINNHQNTIIFCISCQVFQLREFHNKVYNYILPKIIYNLYILNMPIGYIY